MGRPVIIIIAHLDVIGNDILRQPPLSIEMKPTPKTRQVFLPEGTPAGIQIAELTS